MSYIAADEIRDSLIGPEVMPEDLEETDSYLDAIATRFDEAVSTPLAWQVKKLAIAFCCAAVCIRLTGQGGRVSADGADAWSNKLKIYRAEIERWESEVTAELISGDTTAVGSASEIQLFRA